MAYFREKLKSVFKVKDTPHRIALAFSLGVFMGISPFLGLHYIGGFFIAWLFRLNKLVAMVGVSVNNPWTIVPISTFCAWCGAKMLGIKKILPEVDWGSLTLTHILGTFSDLDTLYDSLQQLWPLIGSFFVGSLVVGTFATVGSYLIIKILIVRFRKEEDVA
jgi:hypothetical protein